MIEEINKKQADILKGEFAALMHDIGKCHTDFLKKNSVEESIEKFEHGEIDKFLDKDFIDGFIKNNIFKFELPGKLSSDMYSIIVNHHERDDRNIGYLEQLFIACDKKDSADDKGAVRTKQSEKNTIIASPFGREKEKIDLDCLKCRFDRLVQELKDAFKRDIDGKTTDLTALREFRKSLMAIGKSIFSHALGETRIPANEVTLWDHSYSVASLYKSALCGVVLGACPEKEEVQWRLFGICWDGYAFIEGSKKIADIQYRKQIIENFKKILREIFEEEYPIGNVIYEDVNGIYFTFPGKVDYDNKNEIELARECVQKALDEWYGSNNDGRMELFPFFILSEASRSLTILGSNIRFADEKMATPKMGPVLFIEEESGYSEEYFEIECFKNLFKPIENNTDNKVDICPVCRIRSKSEADEMCAVCLTRRQGRLNSWIDSNMKNTIWTDDVADENNRIALLSLNFGLDNWLDGRMVKTIYSQTFKAWWHEEKDKLLSDYVSFLRRRIENRNASEKAKFQSEYNAIKKELDDMERRLRDKKLGPTKDTANSLIERVFEMLQLTKQLGEGLRNYSTAAKILNALGATVNKDEVEFFCQYPNSGLFQKDSAHTLAALFTKNPSPARLMRIWHETEEFWADVVTKLKQYPTWERLKFKIDSSNMQLKENTNYILKFIGLEPDTLIVCYTSEGSFVTIESLDKFSTGKGSGFVAIEEILVDKGFYYIAEEEVPDKNLLEITNGSKQYIKANEVKVGDYHPFIEVIRTPLMLNIIVPANDAVKILQMITSLYNERFSKVIGKLPLNASLLVANRKFPLYIMLEMARKFLLGREFKEQVLIDVWWDIGEVRDDDFYCYYPIKKLKDAKHYVLDDLKSISAGRPFAMYPGYFDFEFLRGNEDRYKIVYNRDKKRADEDSMIFSARPYYMYQFNQMVALWDILKNNISATQINFVERALVERIRDWRNVQDPDKEGVFRNYAEAVLWDAFAENWGNLREETRFFLINSVLNNLMLDTISLFKYVIKEKIMEVDKDEQ